MTCQLLYGKELARNIVTKLKQTIKARAIRPGLAIVVVGDDPASHMYVAKKEKTCQQMDIKSTVKRLPSDVTEQTVLSTIDELNTNPTIHGILVQLPLPSHLSEHTIIAHISPEKDVDGIHPHNLGKLINGTASYAPCTPQGIMHLFNHHNIPLKGTHVVVIGRSLIVGKPLTVMLTNKHATVTLCHSKTKNLVQHTSLADIIISATGKKHMITGHMIRNGACVIDVGITRTPQGGITGDVDRESVMEKAKYLTPVPGGVGPLTIAMLMHNVVHLAQHN